MEDSEVLIISEIKKKDNNGDLFQVGNKMFENINLKIASMLFILYIILNSDIFVENCLSKMFKNTYDSANDKVMEKGVVISGLALAISSIILDVMDRNKYI